MTRRKRLRAWTTHYRGIDKCTVSIIDGPDAKPYLRFETREGLYVDSVENPRTLRAIGERLLWALDRRRS